MRAEKIIRVTTYSSEENRFMYNKFPSSDCSLIGSHSAEFYIDLRYEKEVYKAIDEWNKRSKK